MTAVEKGAKDVAALLISHGADPKERTREGADCVLTACYCGQAEMLKWVVKGLNLSLETEDTMHNRAIHCAAASTNLATLKFVLEEMPGELNVTNGNGHTPVEICAFKAAPKCVRYLLSKNCLVSNIDPRGNTTVHLAVAGGDEECFRLILHTPGSLHAHLNNEGISAASIAEAKGPHLVRAYREFLVFLAAREGKLEVLRDLHERYDIPITICDPFQRSLANVTTSPEVLEFLASDAKQHSAAPPSQLDAFFIAVLTFASLSLLFARK